MNRLFLYFFYSSLLLNSCLVFSAPYQPVDKEEVIASWNNKLDNVSNDNKTESLEDVLSLFEEIQKPGKSSILIPRVESILEKHAKTDHQTPLYLYLKARLLQHKHKFNDALAILNQLLEIDPSHGNAWLLKASMHIVLAEYNEAQTACNHTLSLLPANISFICLSEVTGLKGNLKKSYQLLESIDNSISSIDDTNKEWLYQIASQQALELGKIEDALRWINKINIKTASISSLLLWTDLKIAKGDYSEAYEMLNEIFRNISLPDIDDSVLVRFAQLERELGKNQWQPKTAERINLRVLRDDVLHSSEIARYYIEVTKDPDKAVYWAQRNWEISKFKSDQELLSKAIGMEKE